MATFEAFDRWLLQRFSREGEHLDPPMIAISQAADRSKLWLAIAAVVAIAGRRPGRAAAKHGILAIALASAIVNGPLKLLVRRPRPSRRSGLLRRAPRTYSFPSDHSAAAFAFATAATRQVPVLAGLLVPLASAVAFSRVHLRVHYPSDVLLGAALGAAIGSAVPCGASASPSRPAQ